MEEVKALKGDQVGGISSKKMDDALETNPDVYWKNRVSKSKKRGARTPPPHPKHKVIARVEEEKKEEPEKTAAEIYAEHAKIREEARKE